MPEPLGGPAECPRPSLLWQGGLRCKRYGSGRCTGLGSPRDPRQALAPWGRGEGDPGHRAEVTLCGRYATRNLVPQRIDITAETSPSPLEAGGTGSGSWARQTWIGPRRPPPSVRASGSPSPRGPAKRSPLGVKTLDKYGIHPIVSMWMATVIVGDFEWDEEKEQANITKHGVGFAEAATAFADPMAVYLDNGSPDGNMVLIGTSLRQRLLFVVHVQRGERDRIISARKATRAERDVYESGGN
jgi:uncharacterized protein